MVIYICINYLIYIYKQLYYLIYKINYIYQPKILIQLSLHKEYSINRAIPINFYKFILEFFNLRKKNLFSKFRSKFFIYNQFVKFFKLEIFYLKKNFLFFINLQLFIIAKFLSILSITLYNLKTNNLKTFFAYS